MLNYVKTTGKLKIFATHTFVHINTYISIWLYRHSHAKHPRISYHSSHLTAQTWTWACNFVGHIVQLVAGNLSVLNLHVNSNNMYSFGVRSLIFGMCINWTVTIWRLTLIGYPIYLFLLHTRTRLDIMFFGANLILSMCVCVCSI